MTAIPECYRDYSRWEIIRTQVEHEYWRNIERDLTPDNMALRVGELADCLERDFAFTTRSVGGDWYVSTSDSNMRMLYDYFTGSKKVLAVNPRAAAIETAARRLLPPSVEWEVYDDATGFAAIIIKRIFPPAPEPVCTDDYRKFF